ncbi:MAG TPA: tRNA pseudouridine(55) synthase TruB [Chitinophagaceae bacterium]|nr:tRNA pseudouridine(55) synthase TruB [Chitinophagaceae bacterium]MCC6635807.1 tRNA pseudouridine(55) synthase TruB [Chitinophagaceae bacterium]HNE93563.1 tRNA pseudouridine(55) synthase TruB [Chitinophagaceae bacterium]HNF30374.1 tRNA pseudouridine(55) synthase TruB [Chitinophagaceae bacterium]HNM33896.1 tRNA pseudouridine(55) synthase TruB [Chitinophagaceae bacterium]
MQPIQKFLDGQVLLFYKPLKWTSFDVVKKIRSLIKVSKIGHAGTLDPLATGLLIICTGKFTKKINEFMGQPKTYTGSFTLGATTSSYDLEQTPENFKDISHLTATEIYNATLPFIGNILQMPPQHSAIKKDGKRLYEMARKGIEVKVEPRPVTIYTFEITKIELPLVYFKVICSTGTYIRSLANDFGNALNTGAYLSSLCRTDIGEFNIENAYTIESFENEIAKLRNSETTI